MSRWCGIKDNNTVLHRIDLFHDFGKIHRFIYSGNRKCKVLHHSIQRIIGRVIYSEKFPMAKGVTLFNHFADRACRIDFHGRQIIKSVDFTGILSKLLAKSIRKIVRYAVSLEKRGDLSYLDPCLLRGQIRGLWQAGPQVNMKWLFCPHLPFLHRISI